MKVKESDIEQVYMGCPYCGTPRDIASSPGCCGESAGHFTTLYELTNGDFYPDGELEIID